MDLWSASPSTQIDYVRSVSSQGYSSHPESIDLVSILKGSDTFYGKQSVNLFPEQQLLLCNMEGVCCNSLLC